MEDNLNFFLKNQNDDLNRKWKTSLKTKNKIKDNLQTKMEDDIKKNGRKRKKMKWKTNQNPPIWL